ncbi:SufD family Fe-S cluster assembly protein, partial [Microvirga sp. 3-52]|nr:SufD family Fe-S cluster assembly protein [Microvirga sp. 3-52]
MSTVSESKGKANIVSEVFTGDNAQVTYGAVDVLPVGFTTYVNRRGIVGRDSQLNWALGLMNDCDTISENITHLVGDGSDCDMKTVVVGRGKQRQNFTTEIISWGKNSNGMILKHAVVKDESTAIFNGIGKITKGATGSNAEQESRMLILSDRARADAN